VSNPVQRATGLGDGARSWWVRSALDRRVTHRLPEPARDRIAGVNGDLGRVLKGLLQQGVRDRAGDPSPARPGAYEEAAHPLGGGIGRLRRQAAHADQLAILERTEQGRERLRPLGDLIRQAAHVPVALRVRLGAKRREAVGQSASDANELEDHQPGLIIFSGRTHSSNSSLVR
jgi:hypothetical protein